MIESTRTEMEVKGRDENLNEGRPSLLAAKGGLLFSLRRSSGEASPAFSCCFCTLPS
jgi:hypothetical protein